MSRRRPVGDAENDPSGGSSSGPTSRSDRDRFGDEAAVNLAASSSAHSTAPSPPSSRSVPMPRLYMANELRIEESPSVPADLRGSREGPRQSEDMSMPMSSAPSDDQNARNSRGHTASQEQSTMLNSTPANATSATYNSSSGSDFAIPGMSQVSSEESKDSEQPEEPLQVFNTLEQHQNGTCKPCRFFQLKAKGCRLGDACRFCHYCSRERAKSDRLRVKYEVRRNKRLRSHHGAAEAALRSSTSEEEE